MAPTQSGLGLLQGGSISVLAEGYHLSQKLSNSSKSTSPPPSSSTAANRVANSVGRSHTPSCNSAEFDAKEGSQTG